MANTKQAIKAVRKTVKKTSYNKWWKNQIRSAYKSVMTMLNSEKSDKKEASAKIAEFQKKLDKSVKSNVVHKNKAARLKSQVMKKAKSAA